MHEALFAVVDRPVVTHAGDPFATWFGAFTRWRPACTSPAEPARAAPLTSVTVSVLGELEVLVGGVPASEGLRRRRVRTMVQLLAAFGSLRRERLADLMWPELEPAAASANLRITLFRLRALLGGGERDEHDAVQADSVCVSLARTPRMRVDLWDFDDDVAAADAAERAGDTAAVVVALERACGRWRGEPFVDLDGIDAIAPDIESVRRRVAGTALRLATLHLDAGRFAQAAHWSQRVRAAEPYDERAHRVAIAAHLGLGDRAAALEAARLTRSVLAELDVDPEPATDVLLRACGPPAGVTPGGR